MEKRYTFIYEGQTHKNFQPIEVKEKLSRVFDIPIQALDGIFGGSQYFERDDLPKAVAKQYLQLFQRAGAIGIIKESRNEAIKTPAKSIETQEEQENLEQQSRNAAKLLKRSGLLIFATFIIDNTLRGSGFFYSDSDIGYLPYIITHLFLIYACARAAISKGYSLLWGGLGGLSFIGVAILLTLPRKQDKWSLPSYKVMGIVVLCLVISSAWIYDFANRQLQLLEITQQSAELQHIDQFPTKIPEITSELLWNRKKSLDEFQNKIFNSIDELDYRPNEKKRLADLAFNQTANYRIWLNYLRYLSYTRNLTFLPELSKKSLNTLDNNIAKKFNTVFPQIGSQALLKLREEWQWGLNAKHEQKIWGIEFNLTLRNIRKAVEKFAYSDKNGFHITTIDISSLDLIGTKGMKVTTTKNTVKIEIVEGPMSGELLVLSAYKIPNEFLPESSKSYQTIIEPIFVSFPAKYLPMRINPLKRYRIDR